MVQAETLQVSVQFLEIFLTLELQRLMLPRMVFLQVRSLMVMFWELGFEQ